MPIQHNYYEILQVSRQATLKEITKAYRKQAKLWFPSVGEYKWKGEVECNRVMKLINLAYEILSNEQKRSSYNFDNLNHDYIPKPEQPPPPPKPTPQRGADLYHAISISWIDGIYGVEKEIKVIRAEECNICKGTGSNQGNPCSSCKNTGFKEQSKTILIKIPKGIIKEKRIKLTGAGHSGKFGGIRGDLFINVTIAPGQNITFITKAALEKASCFIYLLDQSTAMELPITRSGNISKAAAITEILNRHFRDLAIKFYERKINPDTINVAFVGYSDIIARFAGSSLESNTVNIEKLAENPLRLENKKRKFKNKEGIIASEQIAFPIWIDALAKGSADIIRGIEAAIDIANKWNFSKLNISPAAIINITAPIINHELSAASIQNIKNAISKIGKTGFWNICLGDGKRTEISFPDSTVKLQNDFDKLLFNASTVLPISLKPILKYQGYNVTDKSKSYITNASQETVAKFLQAVVSVV